MSTRQDEFERTAMPHSRSLLRVARRLTADASQAEDLVQETFLLAWRYFHQLRPETRPRAWLFRILINAFYAQVRKERASPRLTSFPHDGSKSTSEPAGPLASFAEAAEVGRALDALHIDHRTVLLLGVVEGFTCREIAGILSLPLGTVMSRLSRARHALREQLAPVARYAGGRIS